MLGVFSGKSGRRHLSVVASASHSCPEAVLGDSNGNGRGGEATAFVEAAAAPAEGRRRLLPLSCDAPGEQDRDREEVLQLRAAGERAQGRAPGDGLGSPAEEELEARLGRKEGRADKTLGQTQQKRLPARHDDGEVTAGEAANLEAKVTSETPWQLEKVWSPAPVRRPRPKRRVPRPFPPLHTPKVPSRHDLLFEGPFPVEKRLAELAAHAYYLWGDARFLSGLAGGTRAEARALGLERLAKHADSAGRAMVAAAHLPTSRAPPHLPLSVSGVVASPLPLSLAVVASPLRTQQSPSPERNRGGHFL